MQVAGLKNLLPAVALLAAVAPVRACGGLETMKFPGLVRHAVLRNDHLLCISDSNHMIVVDLNSHRSFDLGPSENWRWDGDVADGQALMMTSDRLEVVALASGKIVQSVAVPGDPVRVFGFAGQGRAFVHQAHQVTILDLATGAAVHTIDLGKEEWRRGPGTAWQKVDDRLFVVGPEGTLCVIDLATGKLSERIAVESRAGIQDFRVEGDLVYCVGSLLTWSARIDHLTCVNLKTKKTTEVELNRVAKRGARFAAGPKGSVYLIEGDRIDQFAAGQRTATCAPRLFGGNVLAVWNAQAITSAKDALLLECLYETPVTKK
jgi:hypothetical protein